MNVINIYFASLQENDIYNIYSHCPCIDDEYEKLVLFFRTHPIPLFRNTRNDYKSDVYLFK